MSNMNDLDMFELDDDLYDEEYSSGYSFDDFKTDFPAYLDSLNNHIRLYYNTYVLVYNKRFLTINKKTECLEVAKKCRFGMLLRHALETIVTSIATENGIEVGGRSVFERLGALKGQSVSGYDDAKKTALSKLLDITNGIAHPHITQEEAITFAQLKDFYDNTFKDVMEAHILYIEDIKRKSKTEDFGVPKEVLKSRNQAYKYLLSLKKQLDEFNIFKRKTSILIQGCLVRQLTECSANLWCYNNRIVPTDASTFENQISLGKVLDTLSRISKLNKKTAFGSSALTVQVVSNLYDLKAASNSLMHVDKFGTGNLIQKGKELSKLYKAVKSECSPHVMKKKLSEADSLSRSPKKKIREKSPFVAALLCGTLGWFGAHHFYIGSIFRGVVYFLFGGFIIGPALDLYKMLKGRFRNSRGIRIKKTAASSFTAFVLLAAHLLLLYTFATKVPHEEVLNRIKDFNPLYLITLKKCDDSEIASLNKVLVSKCVASSHLSTASARYGANLCIDGNSATCWQEGVIGNGEGESITFSFAKTEKISAISILNGKCVSEKAFYDNARASKLIIEIGNIQYRVKLKDIMERQSFSFITPKETDKVKITIDRAYTGNAWEDLCISEVEFYN